MRHEVVVLPLDYGAFLDSKCLRRKPHIPHGYFHDRKCTRFGISFSSWKTGIGGRRFQTRQPRQISMPGDRRNEDG